MEAVKQKKRGRNKVKKKSNIVSDDTIETRINTSPLLSSTIHTPTTIQVDNANLSIMKEEKGIEKDIENILQESLIEAISIPLDSNSLDSNSITSTDSERINSFSPENTDINASFIAIQSENHFGIANQNVLQSINGVGGSEELHDLYEEKLPANNDAVVDEIASQGTLDTNEVVEENVQENLVSEPLVMEEKLEIVEDKRAISSELVPEVSENGTLITDIESSVHDELPKVAITENRDIGQNIDSTELSMENHETSEVKLTKVTKLIEEKESVAGAVSDLSSKVSTSNIMKNQISTTRPHPVNFGGVHHLNGQHMPSAPLEELSDTDVQYDPLKTQHTFPSAPTMPVVPSAPEATGINTTENNEDLLASASSSVRSSYMKNTSTVRLDNLYPAVPMSTESVVTKLHEPNLIHSTLETQKLDSWTTPRPIQIKLEPSSSFELSLLKRAAAQKRHHIKMRNIERNKGDLYARLEVYLFSEYLLSEAATSLDFGKRSTSDVVDNVWALETKRLSSKKQCGDHVDLEQILEFQTAKLEVQELSKLKAHLAMLRQLRTVEASLHTTDRAIAYFSVEKYLSTLLHDPLLTSLINSKSTGCRRTDKEFQSLGLDNEFDVIPANTTFHDKIAGPVTQCIEHLKYCVDVLVFFEKQVTVESTHQLKASGGSPSFSVGLFDRVPASFQRGEFLWQSQSTSHNGMERKIKCHVCGALNSPPALQPQKMKLRNSLTSNQQWCKPCEGCDVLLCIPPSAVSTSSNEWFCAVSRFRESVRKWISICVHTLLSIKSLEIMPFVLSHILFLPRVGTVERSWIIKLLKFPKAIVYNDGSLKRIWTEDLVDHYLAMMHLLFHPEKLRRASVMVTSDGREVKFDSNSISNGSTAIESNAQGQIITPEWILLEHPEAVNAFYLSDEDYCAVLRQFPNEFALQQLFSCTIDIKKCFSRTLTLVTELVDSLKTFHEFEKFPLECSRLLSQVLTQAANILVSSSHQNYEIIGYPTPFDQVFCTAVKGLVNSTCSRVSWQVLQSFPFGALSDDAKWDVLSLLLFGKAEFPKEMITSNDWWSYVESTSNIKSARDLFYRKLCKDTECYMHLLHAIASLAASCTSTSNSMIKDGFQKPGDRHDLVLVATEEIFRVGFTISRCSEAFFASNNTPAQALSIICLAHPYAISILIDLLYRYHECIILMVTNDMDTSSYWVRVFETFPISRWIPTVMDLQSLQEWLFLEDLQTPCASLARFLLSRINWEFDVYRQRLFTHGSIHRQVGMTILEALIAYYARIEAASKKQESATGNNGDVFRTDKKDKHVHKKYVGPGISSKAQLSSMLTSTVRSVLWMENSFDFPAWCWSILLKLKFFSPITHEPFVPLIDLECDRTREATLLRRWYAAIPLQHVMTQKLNFYTSLEQVVLHRMPSNNEPVQVLLVGQNSSTGAPIQESENTDHQSKDFKQWRQKSELTSFQKHTVPFVSYIICQTTSHLYTHRMDKYEPLVRLLKSKCFEACLKVLENYFLVCGDLSKYSTTEHCNEESSQVDQSRAENEGISVCMAEIEGFSNDELIILVHLLYEYSYLSADEHYRLEELLHKESIGLSLSTTSTSCSSSSTRTIVLSRIRLVRECASLCHPIVLPALFNEGVPASLTISSNASSGIFSWLSSAFRSSSSNHSPKSSDQLTAERQALMASGPPLSIFDSVHVAIRQSPCTAILSSTLMSGALSILPFSWVSEPSATCLELCKYIFTIISSPIQDMDSKIRRSLYWFHAILQVPFWYENANFHHVVDYFLHTAMMSNSNQKNLTNLVLKHLVDQIERSYQSYCLNLAKIYADQWVIDSGIIKDILPKACSFVPDNPDSTTLNSMFGSSKYDVPSSLPGAPNFSFWCMLVETKKEIPLYQAMGQIIFDLKPKVSKRLGNLIKSKGKLTEMLKENGLDNIQAGVQQSTHGTSFGHMSLESIGEFKIFRWCEYCLDLPDSEPMAILYWQILMSLYFAAVGGGMHIFGYLFLEMNSVFKSKRAQLRKNLQEKCRILTNYWSMQAQLELTSGSNIERLNNRDIDPCRSRYQVMVALSQLYTAIDTWLEGDDPNNWVLKEEAMQTLPKHFEVKRLQEVLTLSERLMSGNTKEVSNLPLWFELVLVVSDNKSSAHNVQSQIDGNAPLLDDADFDFAIVEDTSTLRQRNSFGNISFSIHIEDRNYFGIQSNTKSIVSTLDSGDFTDYRLAHLPHVTLQVTPDACTLTLSPPLNTNSVKEFAMQFSEKLSMLVALDVEYLEYAAQLYRSHSRSIVQTKFCAEGPNGCKSPASFKFEFLEWLRDSQSSEMMNAIERRSERCDLRSMVAGSSMIVHSFYEQTLSNYVDSYDEKIDEDANSLSEHPDRNNADEFLQLDSNESALITQLLLIDEIVRLLDIEIVQLSRELERLTVQNGKDEEGNEKDIVERKIERLHEKALEWFHVFTALDTKLFRMVPPVREVVYRSIQRLGSRFISTDERETFALLKLMLDDPSRIHLLCECFSPATSTSSTFVEMFSFLMSPDSSGKLSVDEKLVLLKRFDFTLWISSTRKGKSPPAKFERDTVLNIVLTEIIQHFRVGVSGSGSSQRKGIVKDQKGISTSRDLLTIYCAIIQLLCRRYLQDHLDTVLHALVGVQEGMHFQHSASSTIVNESSDISKGNSYQTYPVDPMVWDVLITLPLALWQGVSDDLIEACATFLSNHIMNLRWRSAMTTTSTSDIITSNPIVGWQQLGVLKKILDLASVFSRAINTSRQWQLIQSFYDPFLTTLYQPASTTDVSSFNYPWGDASKNGTAGVAAATICSGFVAIVANYLKLNSPKQTNTVNNSKKQKNTPVDSISSTLSNTNSESPTLSHAQKLDQIWSFCVASLVPNAPGHVVKYFHQFFTRLEWEHWCLTIDILRQMRSILQNETQKFEEQSNEISSKSSTSSYPYVSWLIRDILCRIRLSATEEWMAAQSPAIRSAFILEFSQLSIELIMDYPHFRAVIDKSKGKGNRAGVASTSNSMANALPPYFVNFIKQQSTFWSKWLLLPRDHEVLLQFTHNVIFYPVQKGDESRSDGHEVLIFPSQPNATVLQDAFTRLQLVLRLVKQTTALQHKNLTLSDAMIRSKLFITLLVSAFERHSNLTSLDQLDDGRVPPWITVLFSACLSILYEKLDEFVQFYGRNPANIANSSVTETNHSDLSATDYANSEFTNVIATVLRLCSLPLVEPFFRNETSLAAGFESRSVANMPVSQQSLALSWSRCGNLLFVEIDSVIREFAVNQKQTLKSSPVRADTPASKDDESNGTVVISPVQRLLFSIGNALGRVLWSFLAFRGGEVVCLAACGRAIASVHIMSAVAEKCIEKWLLESPSQATWTELASKLKVPELSRDEFVSACLSHGHILTLMVLFLQQLQSTPVFTESFCHGMLERVMKWCQLLQVPTFGSNRQNMSSHIMFIERKILYFGAEVVHFICQTKLQVLPEAHRKEMLRQLSKIFINFATDRKNSGIMKAIGLGGSLQYSIEFHLSCYAIGLYLRLQTRSAAPLRLNDKVPLQISNTGEKLLKGLETLMVSKDCSQNTSRKMDWIVDFIKDPTRSLADQDEFFVALFSRMYPSHTWMLSKCIQ